MGNFKTSENKNWKQNIEDKSPSTGIFYHYRVRLPASFGRMSHATDDGSRVGYRTFRQARLHSGDWYPGVGVRSESRPNSRTSKEPSDFVTSSAANEAALENEDRRKGNELEIRGVIGQCVLPCVGLSKPFVTRADSRVDRPQTIWSL